MHEITDMDTYYELLADRRAARIYEKTRARHPDPRDPDHPGPRFEETYCSQCGGRASALETAALAVALITSTGSHQCAINAQKETPRLIGFAGRVALNKHGFIVQKYDCFLKGKASVDPSTGLSTVLR